MPKVSIIRVPRLPSPSRAGARRFARRAGSAVASAAKDEKHTLVAAVSAAAFGYAERPGKDGKSFASKLPKIPGMSTVGSAAAIAFVASKVMKKNRVLRHVATGLISVAAYKLGKGGTEALQGEDDDDDVSGGY